MWDVYFEAFVENDGARKKILFVPEFVGSERFDDTCDDFVLDGVTRVERRDRDVLFLVVGVLGSIARNTGRHFLDGVGRGVDDGAVGLVHAHDSHVHLLVAGAVAEDEFAQLLDAGIALHADARGNVAFAGAIIFKSHCGVIFFDDERFLRIVGWLRFLLRGFRG